MTCCLPMYTKWAIASVARGSGGTESWTGPFLIQRVLPENKNSPPLFLPHCDVCLRKKKKSLKRLCPMASGREEMGDKHSTGYKQKSPTAHRHAASAPACCAFNWGTILPLFFFTPFPWTSLVSCAAAAVFGLWPFGLVRSFPIVYTMGECEWAPGRRGVGPAR